MLSRSLVLAIVLTGAGTMAQDASFEFDGSLPDASVGQGGADQNQEMNDGTSNTVCAMTRDCERGFVCSTGRCTYNGYREATCGCSSGGAALLFPLGLVLRWRRRRAG